MFLVIDGVEMRNDPDSVTITATGGKIVLDRIEYNALKNMVLMLHALGPH